MANIIIKNEAHAKQESRVLQTFIGDRKPTAADRDAAQVIAARTRETHQELKRMEGN